MSSQKWKVVDTVLAVVGGLCGLAGLLTGFKSSEYEQDELYKDLEKKYGLSPIDEEDE